MDTMILPVVALMIEVLLMSIYFSHEREKNSETNIYSHLVLINFIDTVICILIYIYANKIGNESVVGIGQKVYMVLLLLMTVFINSYSIKLIKFKTTIEKILIAAYHIL